MPIIKCNNTRHAKGGEIEKCDRFFLQLPRCLVDAMKNNPDQRIIVRCPTCPSYQRWIGIYYDAERGMVWESMVDKPEEFEPEMVFDVIDKSEQVG